MPYSGPQWEFRVDFLTQENDSAAELLNAVGREGWQLVSVTVDPTLPGGLYRAWMQRRYIEQLTGPRPPPRLPATEDHL